MPIFLPMSSFKTTAAVLIAGVFFVAAAVIYSGPSVSHFVAFYFPIIYDNTVFLVKPLYLYLLINFIIVSIVATSKLTQKSYSVDDTDVSEVVTVIPVTSDIKNGYLNVFHVASVENDTTVEDVRKFPEVVADDKAIVDDQQTEKPEPSSDSPELETEKSKPKNDSILKHTRKPPRFRQQKSLYTSPEGGGTKKSPRRQDTLETTWKKITEGSSTPLTKHLTKSDTWQERTSHVQNSPSEKMVTKSDNLKDRNDPTEKTRLLKREASPDQEELNRRVEAFIKKFNEEMRLQRLESLAKYNDFVNGRTPL